MGCLLKFYSSSPSGPSASFSEMLFPALLVAIPPGRRPHGLATDQRCSLSHSRSTLSSHAGSRPLWGRCTWAQSKPSLWGATGRGSNTVAASKSTQSLSWPRTEADPPGPSDFYPLQKRSVSQQAPSHSSHSFRLPHPAWPASQLPPPKLFCPASGCLP